MDKNTVVTAVEQEVNKPDCFIFQPLIEQLEKADPKHLLIFTLKTLQNHTCASLLKEKIALPPPYHKKMQILSILTSLQGQLTYSLLALAQDLNTTVPQTIKLLLQASIFKLIAVKIDQERQVIKVSSCKVRERQTRSLSSKSLSAKITNITEKNGGLQKQLKRLQDKIEGRSSRRESALGMTYF